MLAIAPALGLAAAPAIRAASLLVLPGLLFVFLARYAALPAATRIVQGKGASASFLARRIGWSLLYVALSAGALAAAWRATPDTSRAAAGIAATWLLALGGIHAALALVSKDRTVWGELLGMAGLAGAAPFVAFAGGAPPGWRPAAAGGLALAYFASSVALVRGWRTRQGREREAAARILFAHVGLAAGVAVLSRAADLPAGAAAAFLVPCARAVWSVCFPAPTLRALGFRELGTAAVFVAVALLGLLL